MGDHYNDVNGHLSTVTMSDSLTHLTNEVRETQIFQLFWAFKITFQWTFMNLRAERLLQTSFLSKGQCLFWTFQFGRICFAWTFACAGALLDITYPSKIHKPCFRLIAVISLFVGLMCITFYVILFIFLCVKWWQLLLHSLITSTKSVLRTVPPVLRSQWTFWSPWQRLIPALSYSATMVFPAELGVSNTVWMFSHTLSPGSVWSCVDCTHNCMSVQRVPDGLTLCQTSWQQQEAPKAVPPWPVWLCS